MCVMLQTVEGQNINTYKLIHVLHKYTVYIHYTTVLYINVYISEVLVHDNSTFVCLLHEAAEQCDHVLQTWQSSVVCHTVYEES